MEWAKAILQRVPQLLIVLGVAVFVVGLTGSVAYKDWLKIPADRQYPIGLGGVVLVLAGIALHLMDKRGGAIPDKKAFDVRIDSPEPRTDVDRNISASGRIARRQLPAGYSLRVLRGYPERGGFVPEGNLIVDQDNGTWRVLNFNLGGGPGDWRSLQIWLIGPDGDALLQCWSDASAMHWKSMEQIRQLTGNYSNDWLQPIMKKTKDMVLCATVDVRRK